MAVLAFIGPRRLPESYMKQKEKEELYKELEIFKKNSIEKLSDLDKNYHQLLRLRFENGQTSAADSLFSFWMRFKNPTMACLAIAERAQNSGNKEDYHSAFEVMQAALDLPDDEGQSYILLTLKELAEKTLASDSMDIEAQVAMAIVETRSEGMPMQGILRLKRILEYDPQNVKVLVQLGHFSIMSGKYDKALERYLSAYEADSSDPSTIFYLAETYARLSKPDDALHWLNKLLIREKNKETLQSILTYFKENYNIEKTHNP